MQSLSMSNLLGTQEEVLLNHSESSGFLRQSSFTLRQDVWFSFVSELRSEHENLPEAL